MAAMGPENATNEKSFGKYIKPETLRFRKLGDATLIMDLKKR